MTESNELWWLIFQADIGRGTLNGRTLGGGVLKAVLMHIGAVDGQEVSTRALADRVGCSYSTALCSIGWLRREGLIVPIPSTRSPLNAYRVSRGALMERAIKGSPLVDYKGMNNRGRKARTPKKNPRHRNRVRPPGREPLDVAMEAA